MRGALYFPQIRVPREPWFSRVLLYWDVAATIAPRRLKQEGSELGTYGRDLVANGLLELVSPDQYTQSRHTYGVAFIEGLLRNEALVERARNRFAHGHAGRLHATKADSHVLHCLEQEALATPVDRSWYAVEQGTAELYMAGLAMVLSRCQEVQMDPVTDDRSGLRPFSVIAETADEPIGSIGDRTADLGDIRTELLDLVLPAPAGPVDAARLASFKKRHGAMLSAFRAFIESKVLQIAVEPTEQGRTERFAVVRDELSAQSDEVEAKLKEMRWEVHPMESSLAVLTPIGGAIAGVGAGTVFALPVAAPLVLIAVGLALGPNTPAKRLGLPLAYAATARARFS